MKVVGKIHSSLVYNRRMKVLASHLSALLPPDATVLDVGCGDGMIDLLIMQYRPDVVISGVDILVRELTHIPVKVYDGKTIPYDDRSFDVVMFIDVLHHTEYPEVLLREAKRVSRDIILLKDHIKDGIFAGTTLRLMDWVGNAHHGVVLPYNYWTEQQWHKAFKALGLTIEQWNNRIGLYPWPASWFFDRSLHFVAKLGQH
jgi:SAM-dependent methyltransferase